MNKITKLLRQEKKLFAGAWGKPRKSMERHPECAFVEEGKMSTIRGVFKYGACQANSKKLKGNHYV